MTHCSFQCRLLVFKSIWPYLVVKYRFCQCWQTINAFLNANMGVSQTFPKIHSQYHSVTVLSMAYSEPHNQLTRLNTVSTMSRLETSPTSTRPVSTANFILIPLIGTPGLSPTAPGRPSFPSPGGAAPAVSSLAIAKEADGTGGVHR